MTNTSRDEKHDNPSSDEERERRREAEERHEEETAPKHKAPFMPDSGDDTPVGDTDQHSDA